MDSIQPGAALRRGPWIALTITVLLLFAGCSSTTGVEESASEATATDVPSLVELQKAGSLSDEQLGDLTPAHAQWRQSEATTQQGRLDDPALRFLASAAPHVSREQLQAMVGLIESHRARTCDRFTGNLGEGSQWGQRGPHHPGRGPKGPGNGPFADLDLTTEQRAQIRQAQQAQRETLRQLRQSLRAGTIGWDEFRAQADAARENFRAELGNILTEEQRTQLENLRRDRMIDHLSARLENLENQVARRIELLTPILDLSEEQAGSLRDVWMGTGAALQSIVDGLQSEELSLEQARTQLHELRTSTHAAVLEILTEEQAQLYEAVMRICGRGGRRGPLAP